MQHNAECLNFPLDQLVALCDLLTIPVPTAARDRAGHLPPPLAAKPDTTTLSLALDPTHTQVVFTSAMPARVMDVIVIEGEDMLVTYVYNDTNVEVYRAVGSAAAAAHAAAVAIAFAPR